jgi:hypothetical protein
MVGWRGVRADNNLHDGGRWDAWQRWHIPQWRCVAWHLPLMAVCRRGWSQGVSVVGYGGAAPRIPADTCGQVGAFKHRAKALVSIPCRCWQHRCPQVLIISLEAMWWCFLVTHGGPRDENPILILWSVTAALRRHVLLGDVVLEASE